MQNYYSIIDCIPYAVHYIPMTYFITGSLYCLILYTCFAKHPTHLLSGNHQFVLCICKSVSVLLCVGLHPTGLQGLCLPSFKTEKRAQSQRQRHQ